MTVSLLATKMHIPRPRENCVVRPRLTAKLDAALDRPGQLALISAPAGFGKTTLLTELASDGGKPVAWISLGDGDNDPNRFWSYVIAACQSIQPGVGEAALMLLQTSQPLAEETIPTLLINDLVKVEQHLILVLDDYHAIENQSIHLALSFLIDHLPDYFHLILATRVDPPVPLARLRARDRLTEIRASDLRFTREEAASFLTRTMGLVLAEQDLDAIEARSEGWIAGLQLAGISMREHKDMPSFIKAFTGSHVFVADYLVEEVLEHQSQDVKTFLLQTSILVRLNPDLCNAVCDRSDSHALLRDIYQANLFLHPLDEEGQWFRYHQLFADLLQARLRQTFAADSIALLHTQASSWYERSGMAPVVEAGEWIGLSVKNKASQRLKITVFDLQPDWGVAQIYPSGAGDYFVEFEPGQEIIIPLKAELPKNYDEGKDVIKVFATVTTTNFRWLELPALDQPPKQTALLNTRGLANSLETLMAAFSAEQPPMRNLVTSVFPSHGWITSQIEINIKKSV